MEMIIRNAVESDAENILHIIENAKLALSKMHIDQWQDGYPNLESILADIKQGISWVMEQDGIILATAAIYIGNEPTYNEINDGKWQTNAMQYGIIHRIAVTTDCKSRGLASAFMDYCGELSRKASVPSMRCDTHSDNIIMQHTLEKNGYIRCGTIYLADGSPRVGYEKVL